MPGALIFDEAAHTYTVDGRRLPSVTTILGPIRPDFSMVPPDVLEQKRRLGTDVHLACELDDLGELEAVDAELQPYLDAWRAFKRDTAAVILLNERRLYHTTLFFAGTLDRLLMMRQHDGYWMVDIKTSADPHPSYGVQCAGYVELLQANRGELELPASVGGGVRRASVHLLPDGKYRLKTYDNPNDTAVFRALLSIHHWKDSAK